MEALCPEPAGAHLELGFNRPTDFVPMKPCQVPIGAARCWVSSHVYLHESMDADSFGYSRQVPWPRLMNLVVMANDL